MIREAVAYRVRRNAVAGGGAWNCGRGRRFAASPRYRGEVVVEFGEVVSHQDQPQLVIGEVWASRALPGHRL